LCQEPEQAKLDALRDIWLDAAVKQVPWKAYQAQ
jgi:hypothetical protein